MLIKPGTDLSLTSNKLISEMSTAANIKSKIVRKDVKIALRAAQYLIKNSEFNNAPVNGLVLCAGMTCADNEAMLIEPPKLIEKSDYICDRRFHLDSILEMCKSERNFGIVSNSIW